MESRNISPGEDEEPQEDYQELSTREETDVERLIEECDAAIANAEAFAEKLSRELQVLDGVSPSGWSWCRLQFDPMILASN